MSTHTNMVVTYLLLVFIWATTPLAIVWSVSDLHPLWALALRFFLALPFAFILLWLFKTRFPVDSLDAQLSGWSLQFYWLADFYLSGHGLSQLRHYCADVWSGTYYYRIDWPFRVSAQALCFTVERDGDSPDWFGSDLSRW